MPIEVDLSAVEFTFFEPLLHETFQATPWDGPPEQLPVALELVRAVAEPMAAREGRRAPFSLFFNGPAGTPLKQGTHFMTHPHTGEISLFLVPIARKDDRWQVQAVFN